ncbi:MAG: alpha/beta hydrolase [Chloroflexota bacterium]
MEAWLPVSEWGPKREVWRQEIINLHGAEQLESMIEGWVEAARAISASGGNICLAQSGRIQCPVLLLNGTGEVGNTPRDVLHLCETIPNCDLVFVENCGHAIHKDQPEILEGQINSFLDKIGSK